MTNLATIAVVPISDDVPLSAFTMELQHALNAIGKVGSIIQLTAEHDGYLITVLSL